MRQRSENRIQHEVKSLSHIFGEDAINAIKSIRTWNRTRTKTLGGSCAFRYTIRTSRADDWICTSINRFTRPVPC